VGAKVTALVVNQHFYDNLLIDTNVDRDVVDGLLKLGISEVDVLMDSNFSGVETTSLSMGGATVTVNLIGTTDTYNAEYDYLHLKHPV
jgi:MoaA/NifB/PqqE/SkfB family radical SAM enzyme